MVKQQLFNKIKELILLNDKDIQIVDSLFKLEKYRNNEVIHKEGLVCNKLWFIVKGLVRVTINIDGEDRTLIFRNEGDFISNIEVFMKVETNGLIIRNILCPLTMKSIQKMPFTTFYGERDWQYISVQLKSRSQRC